MRTETTTREIYQFAELSDSAKENARNWYRGLIESDELADIDDWQAIAAILGIEFKTRPLLLNNGKTRHESCIYWSGFSSQGDGASWFGWYNYAKGAARKIREYAPMDSELHRIADGLQAVQRRYFYQLSATVTQGYRAGSAYHSGTMVVDIDHRDGVDADLQGACDELRDLLRAFADWIYRQLESQWYYLNSAEYVDESILANAYEFTESGQVV